MALRREIENGKAAMGERESRISVRPHSAIVRTTMSDTLAHMRGEFASWVRAKTVSLQKSS